MGKLQQAHDDWMAARRARATACETFKQRPASPVCRATYLRACQHVADCHTTYTEQLDQRHDRSRRWCAIVLLCAGTAAGYLTAHYFLFN